jgi:hypothetical protein
MVSVVGKTGGVFSTETKKPPIRGRMKVKKNRVEFIALALHSHSVFVGPAGLEPATP